MVNTSTLNPAADTAEWIYAGACSYTSPPPAVCVCSIDNLMVAGVGGHLTFDDRCQTVVNMEESESEKEKC